MNLSLELAVMAEIGKTVFGNKDDIMWISFRPEQKKKCVQENIPGAIAVEGEVEQASGLPLIISPITNCGGIIFPMEQAPWGVRYLKCLGGMNPAITPGRYPG